MELWKAKCELRRVKQQLLCIPELLTEPARRRRHDTAFEASFPCHDGRVALSDRIVLFLIFQPQGIAESVFDTCLHFISKGYAPFVVSNAPLSTNDVQRLKPVTWKALERPNFGYDFGGYRDGILSLRRWKIDPRFLCILNDSIWFPLYDDETLLETAEARVDAVSGTILRPDGDSPFLESYFYLIPRSVYRSDGFLSYWSNMKLTSNKYKVIRQGEKGFSRALITAGTDLIPAYPIEEFVARLESVDDTFLRKTLQYAAFPDMHHTRRAKELFETQSDTWRQQALDFIKGTIPKRLPYSAYPYAMTSLTSYPILKKAKQPVGYNWRKAMVEAWNAGDLPPPRKVVRDEVENYLDTPKL